MAIEIRKSAKAACQQEYYEEAGLRVFAESLLGVSSSYIKMEILINPRLLISFQIAAKRAHRIFVSMIMTIIILSKLILNRDRSFWLFFKSLFNLFRNCDN